MTYLVTGATGLIGNELVRSLLETGNAVNYLSSRRKPGMDSRVAFHLWQRNTDPDLESVPRLDSVVHLAGEPIAQRWTPEVKRRIYSSRIDGTRRLVNAISALEHKPRTLVAASAVGIYGDRGDEILTEASRRGAGFLADVCTDWELESMRAAELGLRVVLVRIPMVLSQKGGALKMMLPPFRLGLGGKFGDGQQWLPWVHLADLSRLIQFAAENESITGPVNANAPNPVRNLDFTHILGHVISRPTLIPVSALALKVVLGELTQFLLGSQRVLPERAQQLGFRWKFPELSGALNDLLR